jgi:hypothetical protein
MFFSHRFLTRRMKYLGLGVILAMVIFGNDSARAQNPAAGRTMTIDNTRSMVWWQIDPHFGHLWATTCPKDPSWQPGEGHSPGYYVNFANRPRIKTTAVAETRVPLFPRKTVRAVCARSVTGTITIADAASYTGVKGVVSIDPDSITMGADARDIFSRKYVYKTPLYHNIEFTIDSLSHVTVSGDTVNAIAHGTFDFRDVPTKHAVEVTGVNDPAGFRVRGKFAFPARDISDKYGVSNIVLGAGVGLKLWNTIYLGFDLIMKPEGAPGS